MCVTSGRGSGSRCPGCHHAGTPARRGLDRTAGEGALTGHALYLLSPMGAGTVMRTLGAWKPIAAPQIRLLLIWTLFPT